MIGSGIITALTPVVEALEALEIPYLIGGSVATSAYGVPRSTLDVDVVAALTLDAVDRLVAALSERYYVDGDAQGQTPAASRTVRSHPSTSGGTDVKWIK